MEKFGIDAVTEKISFTLSEMKENGLDKFTRAKSRNSLVILHLYTQRKYITYKVKSITEDSIPKFSFKTCGWIGLVYGV